MRDRREYIKYLIIIALFCTACNQYSALKKLIVYDFQEKGATYKNKLFEHKTGYQYKERVTCSIEKWAFTKCEGEGIFDDEEYIVVHILLKRVSTYPKAGTVIWREVQKVGYLQKDRSWRLLGKRHSFPLKSSSEFPSDVTSTIKSGL